MAQTPPQALKAAAEALGNTSRVRTDELPASEMGAARRRDNTIRTKFDLIGNAAGADELFMARMPGIERFYHPLGGESAKYGQGASAGAPAWRQ
jgi:hypothetical protein